MSTIATPLSSLNLAAIVAGSSASIPEPSKVPTQLKHVGQRRDYQMIDPRMIDIEPDFNPRNYDLPENRAHLDELKISIGTVGLIHPLIVRFDGITGRATVVDGESRLRAILELIAEGHPILSEADVPCFPAPKGSDDKMNRLLTALTANTGKSLSQWEQGAAFQQLYNMGVSVDKIAAKIGCTVRFVNESMELADAPAEVKQLLSSAAVTPSLAIQITRSADQATAVKTLQAQVQAKQATGQKGPLKRAKVSTTPAAPAKPNLQERLAQSDFVRALRDMLEDVPADDLNEITNEDGEIINEWVTVSRIKLLKLANFAI